MTLKDFFKKDRFAALAGVELLEVRQGYAKARMLVTPEHLNPTWLVLRLLTVT